MKAELSFPPVDLAGLTLAMEDWMALKCFYEMTDLKDVLGEGYTMSDLLGLVIRGWTGMQGAAIRMKEAERAFVADWKQEDKVKEAKTRRRVRKAKKQAQELPTNVTRIDASWEYHPQ
jgi:hypothetical protein